MYLARRDYSLTAHHGDKTVYQRTARLDEFASIDVVSLNTLMYNRYSAVDINLSPTTRHNACMAMLALTVPGLLPPAAAERLEEVFAMAAEDDDRYVMRCGHRESYEPT